MGEASLQITGLADVAALGGNALDYIYAKHHNSPSRTRTYNLAVNSRSLYRLSYRGIPADPNKLMPCPARTVFVRFTAEHYPNSGNVVKGFFFWRIWGKIALILDEAPVVLYTSGFAKLK